MCIRNIGVRACCKMLRGSSVARLLFSPAPVTSFPLPPQQHQHRNMLRKLHHAGCSLSRTCARPRVNCTPVFTRPTLAKKIARQHTTKSKYRLVSVPCNIAILRRFRRVMLVVVFSLLKQYFNVQFVRII